MPTVHIVGAGLAGLACAVSLAARPHRIVLYEAAGQAGGRCRSLDDRDLGCRIDNGNHFLLSANRAALSYLDRIGARAELAGPSLTEFPFVDLATGERWVLRPNPGPLPWWLLARHRRVPGTSPQHYLAGWRLSTASAGMTVAEVIPATGPLWQRFWDPLATAVLNTAPAEASAHLLWTVVRETFLAGGDACRPLLARHCLDATFVAPALHHLRESGAEIHFHRRLRGLDRRDDAAVRLDFAEASVDLAPDDTVVLALPPAQAMALLPGLAAPTESRSIVNAHYRVAALGGEPTDEPSLLGLIGADAQWLVRRGPLVSVTVSAAEALVDAPAENLAGRLWADVAKAFDLPGDPLPPYRVIKEKRATFAQTPAEVARRPAAKSFVRNVLLAGDWTDTGLPATIEGAIRSGQVAAASVP